MIFEILFIFFLFIASGYFALAEIAVIAARKSKLQEWAQEGNKKAETALNLANDPADFLSTVQIGMTLVGILAGVIGGATIADRFTEVLKNIPFFAAYASIISNSVIVIIITYLTLIIGELVPKRIALNNPEKIASGMAFQLRNLSRWAGPLVRFLSFSTDLLLKAFRMEKAIESTVSEAEIRVILDEGRKAGVIEESEQAIVESLFRFGDFSVSSVMTPRTKIVWFDCNDTREIIQQKITETGYSTFPLCQETLENILGIVQSKELLKEILAKEQPDLKALICKPLFIPENTPALKLLDMFRTVRPHTAIVVDEYGSIQGLVTMSNILEAIVGDISANDEEHDPRAKQREDGSWLISGMMPVVEFKELFEIDELPGDEEGHYQTLGGFIISHLGNIPTVADHFILGPLRYEIVDMDQHRVDKVLITKQ